MPKRTDLHSMLLLGSGRLRQRTGWTPRFTLEQTLQDVVNAETD